MDTLVIGAGDTGLSIGAALARRGANITVAEQSDQTGSGIALFEDHQLTRVLIDHEIAAVRFAEFETAGEANSHRPLEAFIAEHRAEMSEPP